MHRLEHSIVELYLVMVFFYIFCSLLSFGFCYLKDSLYPANGFIFNLFLSVTIIFALAINGSLYVIHFQLYNLFYLIPPPWITLDFILQPISGRAVSWNS